MLCPLGSKCRLMSLSYWSAHAHSLSPFLTAVKSTPLRPWVPRALPIFNSRRPPTGSSVASSDPHLDACPLLAGPFSHSTLPAFLTVYFKQGEERRGEDAQWTEAGRGDVGDYHGFTVSMRSRATPSTFTSTTPHTPPPTRTTSRNSPEDTYVSLAPSFCWLQERFREILNLMW